MTRFNFMRSLVKQTECAVRVHPPKHTNVELTKVGICRLKHAASEERHAAAPVRGHLAVCYGEKRMGTDWVLV